MLALLHATRKTLAEHGDKADPATRGPIDTAVAALEAALKGNDKTAIDSAMGQLSAAAQKLGEKIYAGAQQQASGQQAGGPGRQAAGANDDVVDADFNEVRK